MSKSVIVFSSERLSDRQTTRRLRLMQKSTGHSFTYLASELNEIHEIPTITASEDLNFRSITGDHQGLAIIDIALPIDYLSQILDCPTKSVGQLWITDPTHSVYTLSKLFAEISRLPSPQFRAGVFPSALSTTLNSCIAMSGTYLLAELIARSCESNVVLQNTGIVSQGDPSPNSERSKILHHLLLNYNIQDLFPDMPWATNQREVGATCYQQLATSFIKLLDYDAAKDCLRLSDSLMESPRSQGLKALISVAHGETQGAVANLITSLQQYEQCQLRKPVANEFVEFHPTNISAIGANLKNGLDALDNKDQNKAISFLAQAIFEFDSFYREHEVQRLFYQ